VEEGVIMIGAAPCKLSSELHVNERRVTVSVEIGMDENQPKRAQIITTEGREVVGPGYSAVPVIRKQEGNISNKCVIKHERSPVDNGADVAAERRDSGGGGGGAKTRSKKRKKQVRQ
jgi:hypothetical protein